MVNCSLLFQLATELHYVSYVDYGFAVEYCVHDVLSCVPMMAYEDVIVTDNVYNSEDGKVYVTVNDTEMKKMDDQATVVDIELMLFVVVVRMKNDVSVVILVNALIPAKL